MHVPLVVDSVYASTAIAITVLPLIARNPKTPDDIAKQIDHKLQDRLCRLSADPELSDARAYAELHLVGGHTHLLRQMRLMVKWAVEMRKLAGKYDREVEQMEVLLDVAKRLLRFSVRRVFAPEIYSCALTHLFAEMAGLCESIQIDAAQPNTV